MTMLLGINLENRAYLSADTRISYPDDKKEDNIQKIEFLPKHNLIIAAAGKRGVAAAILKAIDNSFLTTKISPDEFKKFLDQFLEKVLSQKLKSGQMLSATK